MATLSIETASVITSVTAVRSEAAVRAALAFAIFGSLVNVFTIALLEFRGQIRMVRPSQRLQGAFAGVGALLPVLALVCLFVGTQPVATIAAAGVVIALAVTGVSVVLWLE